MTGSQRKKPRLAGLETPNRKSKVPGVFWWSLILLEEGIGQDVGIHSLAVFDFVSATAAAAMHRGRIIQTVRGINQDDFAADREAEKLCVFGLGIQPRNIKNRSEYG